MKRVYKVKYKSKSKMLTTPEQVKTAEDDIKGFDGVENAVITEDGQVVEIDAAEEDYPAIMNFVVNVFRKIDDKSEVSFSFKLTHNN